MAKLNEERATWIYKKMNDIRNFEDQVHQIFATGSIPGFVHLYAGEEAVAVGGVCAHLTDDDYITSTHRGHGHCIAKDCSLDHMMAEIYGKETGLCKGKGGSMHIADIDKGMLGANGMVGGGFPIAIGGAALRNQYLKTKDVVVCFFGDGAANEGTFHESINMASIWKLPVVFVNENNPSERLHHSGTLQVLKRLPIAGQLGIPSETVDGKDLMAVYEAAGKAIERARKGEGPTLVECRTYRNYGHFEGDEQKYKATTGKESEFAKRDCIKEFREYALAQGGLLSEESATEIEENSAADIKHAVKFAEESDIPKPETLYQDVFAD